MGELVKFEKQSGATVSIAYEYDISDDKFSWKSDTQGIFTAASSDKIATKEQYSKLIHEDDRDTYNTSFNNTLSGVESLHVTYHLVLPDGRIFKAEDIATMVDEDNTKTIIGIINAQEIDAISHTPNYHDSSGFIKKLDSAINNSQKSKKTGCLIKISLNNIPSFMSWNGADSVNKIMDELKQDITKLVGPNSIINRLSTDEFGIIIEDTSQDSVRQAVNKINHHVKSYRSLDIEEHLRIDASIGSVYLNEEVKNAFDAMDKVFIAISSAKESHKNFYCDYSDAQNEQQFAKEQIKTMYYMKDVVNQDKFMIAYQPIVESRTGKIASYECLLRVKDDEGKISTAWPIIHVAEKTGFIDIVDHFVLEHIVDDLKNNKDLELTFNVSNITTDSPKWLANCTRHFSDPDIASRATIEITETAAERDLKQTAYFVASLQALGCKVALDDFGAGYTSFRQLKSLSVDLVKIDGMFILDLAENSENLLFIKTLLDFNNCYGLQTIAECVESGEVAKLLMDLDVEYMQGYYFGVPNVEPSWKEKG